MTKKIAIYLPLMAITFLMFSCISSDDDEVTGNPTCVITSFSVGDIKSDYTAKTLSGNDTTYSRSISGKNIYFNIDQLKGTISNVDSLAYWVNITRVVPTIAATGTVYYRAKGSSDDYVYLRSGTDSIDFSNGIELRVVSTDGSYSKFYTVSINKSEYETEALNWQTVSSNLTFEGNHRTLAYNGKLYLFAENGGTPVLMVGTPVASKVEWTAATALSRFVDYRSVTLFNGRFYALDAESRLCVSADGADWDQTETATFDRLLTSDAQRLYAYDGTSIVSTTDGANWTEESTADVDALPQMPVSGAAYALKTNSNLQNVVMMGSNTTLATTPVWFKLSASSDESDQQWSYINISDDNTYPMPLFQHVQMVRYDNVLLAFGQGGEETSCANLYVSADNGITWHTDAAYTLTSDVRASEQPLTMAVCEESIYLIQSGGKMWRGIK